MKRLPRNQTRCGVTLLELLIFCALFLFVTVFIFEALALGRSTRGRARDRATMLLIAQSQLEQLRAAPAATIVQGTRTVTDPAWPRGMSVEERITTRPDGLVELDVETRLDTLKGANPVRLTTLRRGGGT